MNRTIEIRSSLVESAANWDSMGKTKLLKLAEAAADSVPQTEWGKKMSALEDRVNNLDQTDANNQLRIINGLNLGDEMGMSINLQTYQYTGSFTLRTMIRGEFIVNGLTDYPLGDNNAGIAIRTSEPVGSPNIWMRWEEIGGDTPDHYSVSTARSGVTMVANTGRDLYQFHSARLSFLCSFQIPANSEVTIWPEFITAGSPTAVNNMFLPGSYIQSVIQLDTP